MLPKDLEKLVLLLKKGGVGEFEWERNKEKIRIKMKGADPKPTISYSAPPALAPAVAPAQTTTSAPKASKPANVTDSKKTAESGKPVISPFVGTFYGSASPGAPKFVELGQQVKAGDVLCIIEAMKIMNEIEADFSGKVVEVLVKNGDPVEFGQTLFRIEPN